MPVSGEHAVVIGASMAGLLTARVLAEHFERVTVFDRDALPPGPCHRRGVPQGHQVHILLPAASAALEELFPGFHAELYAAGVRQADILGSCRTYINGGALSKRNIGLGCLPASRTLVENVVRRRTNSIQNVDIIPECEVTGLLDSRGNVTGVRALTGTGSDDSQEIPADLVVDCAGRGSRTMVWLTQLGYRPPRVEQLTVDVTYLSQRYRVPPGAMHGDVMIGVSVTPRNPRFGVAMVEEDGCVRVSLGGLLGRGPKQNDRALIEFAQTLSVPDVYELLRGAEPVGELVATRFPASVRRRYDRLRHLPDGLVAIGDAVASINPVYAQGISVAAQEALVLRRCLSRGGATGLPHRFYRAAHRIENLAWTMAAGADMRFPEVAGRRPPAFRLVNAYLERVYMAARHDGQLAESLIRVAGLVDPPRTLLRPSVIRRALRATRARSDRDQSPARDELRRLPKRPAHGG